MFVDYELIYRRRYSYRGVIFGWTSECAATDHWIQTMNVDGLPGALHCDRTNSPGRMPSHQALARSSCHSSLQLVVQR